MAINVDSLKSARSKVLRYLGVPALALGLIVTSSQLASGATMSLTVDYTPGSAATATEVAPGSKIDLTATAPISDPGTTNQEIVQAIGTQLKLTSAADIIAPAGWVIYYSTDGTNWSHKIYEGTDIKNVLNKLGLGHYSMTQLPGEAGNFAVAGHRLGSGGIFKNLHTFQKGDIVTVKTAKGTFNYRYLAKKYVKPSFVGVLLPKPQGLTVKPSSDSILTLQTCTSGDASADRLIVWFELID